MATIPTPAEAQYQKDHIDDTRVTSLIVANVVCLALAFVFVGLRFLSRWMKRIKCEADDWLIVAGLVRNSGGKAGCQSTTDSALRRYGRVVLLWLQPSV